MVWENLRGSSSDLEFSKIQQDYQQFHGEKVSDYGAHPPLPITTDRLSLRSPIFDLHRYSNPRAMKLSPSYLVLRWLLRFPFLVMFFFRGVVLPYYIFPKNAMLAIGCFALHAFYAIALIGNQFLALHFAAWISIFTSFWQFLSVYTARYSAFPLHVYYMQMIKTLRVGCETECIVPCCDMMAAKYFQSIISFEMALALYCAGLFIAESLTVLLAEPKIRETETLPGEHNNGNNRKSISCYSNQLTEDDDTGFFEELYFGEMVGAQEQEKKSSDHYRIQFY